MPASPSRVRRESHGAAAAPNTPEQALAARRRWLRRWWIGQAIVLWFLPMLLPWVAGETSWRAGAAVEALTSLDYVLWMGGIAATIAFLQWVLVRPVLAPRRAGRPVRLVWSMIVVGFAVALLQLGAFLLLFGVLEDVVQVRPSVVSGPWVAISVLALLVAEWIGATVLLTRFVGRSPRRDSYLRRCAALLFAGTAVEVVAALPLDLLARRNEDCWCARGTLLTLVVGLTLGALLLGPAILLAGVARRRRWPGGACPACGAPIGPDRGTANCPACGAGWAPERA